MPDFETIASGLRAWAAGDQIETASVELLIWHGTWLRRGDLIGFGGLEDIGDGMWRPHWGFALEFITSSPLCSSSELAILKLAIAIGMNEFRLSGLDISHKRAAAEAFAAACGLRLEPAIPEAGHSHPDFIPGNPATCHRCALEAGDGG